ncbi:Uncharacterised protein [uncultured archaeon]|nr:Uncharacterised protein [uncultured archaeon]
MPGPKFIYIEQIDPKDKVVEMLQGCSTAKSYQEIIDKASLLITSLVGYQAKHPEDKEVQPSLDLLARFQSKCFGAMDKGRDLGYFKSEILPGYLSEAESLGKTEQVSIKKPSFFFKGKMLYEQVDALVGEYRKTFQQVAGKMGKEDERSEFIKDYELFLSSYRDQLLSSVSPDYSFSEGNTLPAWAQGLISRLDDLSNRYALGKEDAKLRDMKSFIESDFKAMVSTHNAITGLDIIVKGAAFKTTLSKAELKIYFNGVLTDAEIDRGYKDPSGMAELVFKSIAGKYDENNVLVSLALQSHFGENCSLLDAPYKDMAGKEITQESAFAKALDFYKVLSSDVGLSGREYSKRWNQFSSRYGSSANKVRETSDCLTMASLLYSFNKAKYWEEMQGRNTSDKQELSELYLTTIGAIGGTGIPSVVAASILQNCKAVDNVFSHSDISQNFISEVARGVVEIYRTPFGGSFSAKVSDRHNRVDAADTFLKSLEVMPDYRIMDMVIGHIFTYLHPSEYNIKTNMPDVNTGVKMNEWEISEPDIPLLIQYFMDHTDFTNLDQKMRYFELEDKYSKAANMLHTLYAYYANKINEKAITLPPQSVYDNFRETQRLPSEYFGWYISMKLRAVTAVAENFNPNSIYANSNDFGRKMDGEFFSIHADTRLAANTGAYVYSSYDQQRQITSDFDSNTITLNADAQNAAFGGLNIYKSTMYLLRNASIDRADEKNVLEQKDLTFNSQMDLVSPYADFMVTFDTRKFDKSLLSKSDAEIEETLNSSLDLHSSVYMRNERGWTKVRLDRIKSADYFTIDPMGVDVTEDAFSKKGINISASELAAINRLKEGDAKIMIDGGQYSVERRGSLFYVITESKGSDLQDQLNKEITREFVKNRTFWSQAVSTDVGVEVQDQNGEKRFGWLMGTQVAFNKGKEQLFGYMSVSPSKNSVGMAGYGFDMKRDPKILFVGGMDFSRPEVSYDGKSVRQPQGKYGFMGYDVPGHFYGFLIGGTNYTGGQAYWQMDKKQRLSTNFLYDYSNGVKKFTGDATYTSPDFTANAYVKLDMKNSKGKYWGAFSKYRVGDGKYAYLSIDRDPTKTSAKLKDTDTINEQANGLLAQFEDIRRRQEQDPSYKPSETLVGNLTSQLFSLLDAYGAKSIFDFASDQTNEYAIGYVNEKENTGWKVSLTKVGEGQYLIGMADLSSGLSFVVGAMTDDDRGKKSDGTIKSFGGVRFNTGKSSFIVGLKEDTKGKTGAQVVMLQKFNDDWVGKLALDMDKLGSGPGAGRDYKASIFVGNQKYNFNFDYKRFNQMKSAKFSAEMLVSSVAFLWAGASAEYMETKVGVNNLFAFQTEGFVEHRVSDRVSLKGDVYYKTGRIGPVNENTWGVNFTTSVRF